MENVIVSVLLGGVVFFVLYQVVGVIFYFAFGDEGFSWLGLGYLLSTLAIFTGLVFAAYWTGNLILRAFG